MGLRPDFVPDTLPIWDMRCSLFFEGLVLCGASGRSGSCVDLRLLLFMVPALLSQGSDLGLVLPQRVVGCRELVETSCC